MTAHKILEALRRARTSGPSIDFVVNVTENVAEMQSTLHELREEIHLVNDDAVTGRVAVGRLDHILDTIERCERLIGHTKHIVQVTKTVMEASTRIANYCPVLSPPSTISSSEEPPPTLHPVSSVAVPAIAEASSRSVSITNINKKPPTTIAVGEVSSSPPFYRDNTDGAHHMSLLAVPCGLQDIVSSPPDNCDDPLTFYLEQWTTNCLLSDGTTKIRPLSKWDASYLDAIQARLIEQQSPSRDMVVKQMKAITNMLSKRRRYMKSFDAAGRDVDTFREIHGGLSLNKVLSSSRAACTKN